MEIKEYLKDNKIIAFGNFNNKDINLAGCSVIKVKTFKEDIFVKDFLEQVTNNEKKVINSCKIINEKESFLYKKLNVLSSSEVLKLLLVKSFFNKENIIALIDFEKYFMEKDLLFFKKLFRKLVDKYNKKIILFSNNVNFMFDLIDTLYLNTGKNIISFEQKDLYNEKIYKYLDRPKIVDFVNYLNSKGKKFLPYTEMKELLKAIYREV